MNRYEIALEFVLWYASFCIGIDFSIMMGIYTKITNFLNFSKNFTLNQV